jgi:hypothetical protein
MEMQLQSSRRSGIAAVAAHLRAVCVVAVASTFALAATAGAPAATTAAAPVNGCPPTVEGTLVVGKTVGAGNGCWQNSPTSYAYKWVRCDQSGTNCVAITGATKQAYTLTSADVGHTLIVFVTATNAAGSTGPVNSKPSDLISAAAPPQFKTRPSVTGKTQVGEALVAKVGTFTGGIPRKFTFQWQRCDKEGQACADISGATAESYGVRSADVDHTLRVKVTASNDYGTVSETSDRSGAVTAIPTPVVATTTIAANRGVTTCCQAVKLSGTVSTHKAGETVVILAREFDDLAAQPVGQATTDASGDWTFVARPTVKTTYRAQIGNAPTAGVSVNVRPRVGFGVHGRRWTVKVSARDSFAGSLVLLQRRAGSRWLTVGRVVLNLSSVAHFTTRPHHASWTVRAVVPSRETGPGYLAATSHALRIRV